MFEPTQEEQKVFDEIKTNLKNAKKPLFFFHDDPDGICSFLQLRKFTQKGYGVIVKSTPNLDKKFFPKIDQYKPDYVVSLDIAMVSREFIDFCAKKEIKIIVVDHHNIIDFNGCFIYYNPKQFRSNDSTACASLCYFILDQKKEYLWLSALGTIADWQKPVFFDELKEIYPDLVEEFIFGDLPKSSNFSKHSVEHLLFSTRIGFLTKIFSFAVKGDMRLVKKAIASFMTVDDYNDVLEQKTSNGKFIYKRFDHFFPAYIDLLKQGLNDAEKQNDKKLILFIYSAKDSYSGELANHLYYYYNDSFIIVGRLKDDTYRISIRYKGNALKILESSVIGLNASGGGHKNSCGALVVKSDFLEFINRIKGQL